jgi:AraC-like DNA-binding protein
VNPILTRTRAALWTAITDEVTLSPDAAMLWNGALDAAVGPRYKGAAQRVITSAGWHYSTTNARFCRLGLPTMSECVEWTAMCYAAALFDGEDDRVASISYTIGLADQQSFNRLTRRLLGVTASEFRATMPFPAVREIMLDYVIRPHRAKWESFTRYSPRWETFHRLGPAHSLAAA